MSIDYAWNSSVTQPRQRASRATAADRDGCVSVNDVFAFPSAAINFFPKKRFCFVAPVRAYYADVRVYYARVYMRIRARKKEYTYMYVWMEGERWISKQNTTGQSGESVGRDGRGELTIGIRWISAEFHYSIKTKLCGAARSAALMAPFISEI